MATRKKTPPDFLSEAKAAVGSEVVSLPEMKRDVVVHALNARQVREITEAHLIKGKKPSDEDAYDTQGINHAIIAASVRDKDGNLLIAPDRVGELDEISSGILTKLQMAVNRLNGAGEGN